jgi:hypothetical protein
MLNLDLLDERIDLMGDIGRSAFFDTPPQNQGNPLIKQIKVQPRRM